MTSKESLSALIKPRDVTNLNAVIDAWRRLSVLAHIDLPTAIGDRIEDEGAGLTSMEHGGLLARCPNDKVAHFFVECARAVPKLVELVDEAAAELRKLRGTPETPEPRSFQDRVFDWARDCFGERDTTDREMRTFRFLEEAIELAQAAGCSRDAALRVLEYVYGRPSGQLGQEIGGTMVSLAVLCQSFHLGMNRCGEAELERVLGKVEQIRARHAAKPDFSIAEKTKAVPDSPGVDEGGLTQTTRPLASDVSVLRGTGD